MSFAIRAERPDDAALIFTLARELADYEKLLAEEDASEAQIAAVLFCDSPRLYSDIAEWDGEAAGFPTWFLNFSTFLGRHGLYVEDIFVRPAFRQPGVGKALMRVLARRCVDEGCARFEWAVLEWKVSAIAFFRSIGAQVLDQWHVCRLVRGALTRFARESAT